MNKKIRNIIIVVSAIIGIIAIAFAVLSILGVDLGIELPECCKKKNNDADVTTVPQTKIKRHYTEIKLPKEA